MNATLVYLAWVTAFTALMWVPYILDRIMVTGLIDAVGYPDSPKAQSPWAQRAKTAHHNAVENLVIFAALVLVAQAMGISNDSTAMAALVYLLARIVHFAVVIAKIPWLRTGAFTVGWVCQMVIAWQILF